MKTKEIKQQHINELLNVTAQLWELSQRQRELKAILITIDQMELNNDKRSESSD